MPGTPTDVAWVDVLPSMKSFLPLLRAGTTSAARTAGAESGAAFANSMADAVQAASGRLAAANKRALDAAGSLTVAQARLTDVQNSGTASASRLAAAEEAVEKAQRNVKLQTDQVAAAQSLLTRREAEQAAAGDVAVTRSGALTGALGKVAGGAGLLTGAMGLVNKAYSTMFAAFTLSLPVIPFVAAVKSAGDFQASLVKLSTTAGEDLHVALTTVSQGVLDMAAKVGVSANDLAKGLYTIESAGFHGADALKVLQAAAEGARQEQADLGNVTNAVSTILHDYHLPASDAADVTSKLIEAVAHGKTTFDELTGSLHSITPLAAALHIPLEDIAGSLAAMTASGESADQATENMRNALLTLQKPSQGMIAELAQLGINAQDLSDDLSTKGLAGTMQEISRAILTNMGPAGKVMLDALNKSQIAAQQMSGEIAAMPPGIKKLSQDLLDGTISLGDYRKGFLALGGQAGAMGAQFYQAYRTSDGFNQILRSGSSVSQDYTQALQRSVGTTAAMTVALQLTSDTLDGTNGNAVRTNEIIRQIAGAAAQADGNIRGWDAVQGTFNQKLAQAGAALGVMGIKLGQVLLPPLGTFLSWVADKGVPGLEHFVGGLGGVVGAFAPLGTVIAHIAGDVKDFIAQFVSSGGLKDLLVSMGGVAKVAIAALAGLGTVVEKVIGTAVHLFGLLPGPVQAVVVAFAALRIAAAAGLFEGLLTAGGKLVGFLVGIGKAAVVMGGEMVAAFRAASAAAATTEFASISAGAATAASGIAGFGAAAGVAARGGLAAMGAGLKGLMDILGGPFGIALLAVGGAIAFIVSGIQRHNAAVEKATQDVTAMYKAMASGGQPAVDAAIKLRQKQDDLSAAQARLAELVKAQPAIDAAAGRGASGYGTAINEQKGKVEDLKKELEKGRDTFAQYWASLTPGEQLTQKVAQAQADLEFEIRKTGGTSQSTAAAADAYRGALDRQQAAQEALNESEKTHLQRLQEIADKELAGISSTLASQQANLQLDDAVKQYNSDAADGTLKGNALAEASNNLAQQAYGAAQASAQAAVDQAKANGVTDDGTIAQKVMLDSLRTSAAQITGPGHDALEQMIATLEKSTGTTSDFSVQTATTGAKFVQVWGANGLEMSGVTADMEKHLGDLGYTVTHLPNGNVSITANTQPGQDEINKFIAGVQSKTVSIFGTVSGIAGIAHNAAGNVLSPMAAGSATVVPPGTLRVIGDNMRSPEAYIPIDSSSRSQALLAYTASQMGQALVPLAFGGVIHQGGPQLPGAFRMPQSWAIPAHMQMKETIDQAVTAVLSAMGISPAGSGAGGGVGPANFSGGGGAMRALGQQIAASMGYAAQFSSIDYIFTHESGWNPNAQNPTSTAYGIPQFLNSTWAAYGGKTNDPSRQIRDGILYMANRYGSPNGAAAFWASHHWYDQGGLWPSGTAGINTSGGVERVLNPPQDNYFQRFVDATSAGAHGAGIPVWHFYLGDREITDLVDARMEYRDDAMARDLRSSV